VSREAGSGTRGVLEAALHRALGADTTIAPPSLALASTSAIRTAVIADAGPAVLSELAVNDDINAGRLTAIAVTDLDLRRTLRAVWQGGRLPPAGPARDLVAVAGTGLRRDNTVRD
jgi:DNA-binding transcriptional LysR family regulator